MNVYIITIHNIPNFGSVFQSYALCKYLNSIGISDVKIIDYNPKYFKKYSLKTKLGRVINFVNLLKRDKKFKKFIEKNIPLTEQSYCTLKELKKSNLNGDIYIAGGDQLWNPYHKCGLDDAYKLVWTNGRKISYGTSMGKKDFSIEELKSLTDKIKDFQSISVRESSSVELLSNVGIKATHVVDPVFLLDRENYEKFLVPINQPKYLLVYLVTPSNLLDKCITYLKNAYDLKVILCSGFSKKCYCDEFLKDLGPDEILSYIKNASIILSSSFHATSFSLIFKKQFFCILPDEHTNERIVDLLTIRNLSDRIIFDGDDITKKLDSKINYNNLSDYDKFIKRSKEYLMQEVVNAND